MKRMLKSGSLYSIAYHGSNILFNLLFLITPLVFAGNRSSRTSRLPHDLSKTTELRCNFYKIFVSCPLFCLYHCGCWYFFIIVSNEVPSANYSLISSTLVFPWPLLKAGIAFAILPSSDPKAGTSSKFHVPVSSSVSSYLGSFKLLYPLVKSRGKYPVVNYPVIFIPGQKEKENSIDVHLHD